MAVYEAGHRRPNDMTVDATPPRGRPDSSSHAQQADDLEIMAAGLARVGGWHADVATGRIRWSPSLRALSGRGEDYQPTIGDAFQVYAPEWRQVAKALHRRCERDGTPFDEEMEILTAVGRRVRVRCIGEAVRDGDGRIVATRGAMQDITPNGPDQRLLGGADQRFRQFADAMPLIVWTAAADGVLDYGNRAFHAYLGTAQHSFRPADWAEAVHPDDLPGAAAAWAASLIVGAYHKFEFRLRRGTDGAYRWFHVTAVPIRDAEGNIVHWYGTGTDVHDRRETEERARLLGDRLNTTLQTMGDGFFILDAETRFGFINAEACRMLLREPDDLLGIAIWDAFPESADSTFRHTFDEAIEGRVSRSIECRYAPSGRWLDFAIHPTQEGLAVYVRDATERRQAEAQLRLMEAAIARLNDIVIITEVPETPEGSHRIIFVNDAFVQRTGWPVDAVLGRSPNLLNGPGTDAAELARIRAAVDEARPARAELLCYTRSGEEFWLEIAIMPMFGAAGRCTHFVAVGRDIGERRRAEQQLLESVERFRIVAKATADTIWDWDLSSGKVWWSDGLHTQFGHDPAAHRDATPDTGAGMLMRPLSDRIHPEDIGSVSHGLQSVIQGNATHWSDEYRLARADGRHAAVFDRGFVIRDASGRALRMVGSMTDVTEQRNLNEQLRQSQRLEALGQLTGGVAHDFNNLLQVVIGNAEMLAEIEAGDAESRPLVEMILQAAERGAELTGHLLSFARQQMLEPQATDIARLVRGLMPLLRRTIHETVEIGISEASHLWTARIDSGQLENAVLNLCINARDAMPNGGRLSIDLRNVELGPGHPAWNADLDPGDYVAVAVRDNGAGIPEDVLARVFEPFFTTKEPGKGSGLGLSMVFGFIKQSRGHVAIESTPGQGTEVVLYLPRADQAKAVPTGGTRSDGAPLTGGAETILLVEDDDLVRANAAAQLRTFGYHVREARNGPDALAILEAGASVDLLFTDVIMPGGLTGPMLARRVAELRPGLPVLYTSGYTDHAMADMVPGDPDLHLLHKPYGRRDLATKVRNALDGRRD